jgi:hypothetical protein
VLSTKVERSGIAGAALENGGSGRDFAAEE